VAQSERSWCQRHRRCQRWLLPSTSAAAELAQDVQGADNGHEDEGQHQNRGRANLQPWGVVCVELQDPALAAGLSATAVRRGHRAPASAAGQGRAVRALADDGKSEGPWVAMYQTEIVSDGSEGAEDGAMKDLLVGSTELEIVRDVSSSPIQGTALVEHAPQEPEAERDASSVSGGVLAGALAAVVGLAGAVAAAVTAQRRKQNARTVATLSPTIGLRSEDSSAELGQGTYGAPLEDNTGDEIAC